MTLKLTTLHSKIKFSSF